MSRRSVRLVTSGYYVPDDDAASTSSTGSAGQISYRESPVRVFNKRRTTGRRAGGSSRASSHTSSGYELPSSFNEPINAEEYAGMGRNSLFRTPSVTTSTSLPSSYEPHGFSSGYSSSSEVSNRRPSFASSINTSSAQSPAEAEFGFREALRSPAHAVVLLYWWLGSAWYSLTSGISLLDVFLLSRRTAGMRKAILLLLLLLFLAFGVWYWYPYVSAHLSQPPVGTSPVQTPPSGYHSNDHVPRFNMAALKDEMHAGMRERQDKWSENHGREMENMMREITLLKQESEVMQTDINHLRRANKELREANNVESEHRRQNMARVERQIIDLGTELEHYRQNMAKLKAELRDWLLQQLSSELGVGRLGVVLHPDLQRALEGLEKRLMDRLGQEREKERSDAWRTVGETLQQEGMGAVTVQDVEQIVQRALRLHRADAIGMADYALESSGASVINTRCSETYRTRSACLSLFGFPLWYHSESPRTVIQPELYPGKCWAFQGAQGFVVIALSYPVHITHVTLEHLPKLLSPTGRIDSAPRDFAVYGVSNENEEGTHLGTFAYVQDGEPIQTFKLPDTSKSVYQMVELRILSNWGHPEYTCVYRFRVHGEAWSA